MLSRRFSAVWVFVVLAAFACAQVSSPPAVPAVNGDLLVHAAASLTDAFTALGDEFSAAYPGTEVTFNFAGSQQLAQQLAHGAPGDVFASANQRQMEVAIEAGRVASGTALTFARNRLVVIVPAENRAGVMTLQDLARPGIKLVLAAPAVPAGAYSLDFLDKAAATPAYGEDFRMAVLANAVSYEENVRAVLSKIVLGEADAGIVYSSDVTGDAVDQVGRIAIPDQLNTVAQYPLAVLLDARNPTLAQTFVAYVLAPEGQAILAKYGLIPVATR